MDAILSAESTDTAKHVDAAKRVRVDDHTFITRELSLLHFRGGSGWMHKTSADVDTKWNRIKQELHSAFTLQEQDNARCNFKQTR